MFRRLAPTKIAAALIVFGLLLFPTGCFEEQVNTLTSQFQNTEDILNRAVLDISANSQNWQQIIQNAINQINPAERQVRQDLEELMQRGVANAGLETRCDISYLGDMLIQGMNRIIAKVKGQQPPPVSAFICNASPSAIDMNLDPNRRNVVEVYGYNLDDPTLRLYHVTSSRTQDKTSEFSEVSPFKRVINLGLNGINLSPQSELLRVDLGHGEKTEIPVIQAYPAICTTKDHYTDAYSIKVIPAKYGPGDDDFDGNGPCIRASAGIFGAASGAELRGTVNVDAWECPNDMKYIHKDYTEGQGKEERVLYTPDQGWAIAEILSPTSGQLEYIDRSTNTDQKADAGLVANWQIEGDTNGGDIGKTFVQVTLNPVHLLLRQSANCVTEEQLAQMTNENQLSHHVMTNLRVVRPQVFEKAQALKNVKKFKRPF